MPFRPWPLHIMEAHRFRMRVFFLATLIEPYLLLLMYTHILSQFYLPSCELLWCPAEHFVDDLIFGNVTK